MLNEKKSTSFALKIENAFSRYYKKIGEDREMPVSTWKQWFERMPICMLRAAPLALQLVAIIYVFRYCLTLFFDTSWGAFSTQPRPFAPLIWGGLFAFVIGSRVANYAEGVMKPTLGTVIKTLRSNWIMIIVISVILLSADLGGEEDLNIRLNNLSLSLMIIIILLGIHDMKAFKPKNAKKSEEPN